MVKSFLENNLPKNQMIKEIYLLIHKYGPITKVDLLEMTKLKQTTIFRIIDRLLKENFIEECGYGDSNGGRPPVLYRINADISYIVSVHISRMYTRVSLHNLKFDWLDDVKFTMTKNHTPSLVVDDVIQIIERFMTRHGITLNHLLGIGIGAIGPLDREKGKILKPEPFAAPGWENVSIVEALRKYFPVKILLENGSTMAALGESKSEYSNYKNILSMISSWGIGCGFITNGEVIRAHHGDVGLYGHMVVEVDGRLCRCGKRGCLQAYTSLYSILEDLKQPGLVDKWNISWARENTVSLIEEMSFEKEATAEVVMRSAHYLGIGLSNIINLHETEVAIISGPLIQYYEGYFEKVKETTLKHIPLDKKVKIVQENSFQSAASVGCAYILFLSFFENKELNNNYKSILLK